MFLKFLKEVPDRYLLVVGFFSVMGFYAFHQNDAILQLLINFAVAIIALSTRKSEPHTAIDTLKTDSVTTESIDNATVNIENLNPNTGVTR